MKMEELDSFQRRGCFLRKGEEFRALQNPGLEHVCKEQV